MGLFNRRKKKETQEAQQGYATQQESQTQQESTSQQGKYGLASYSIEDLTDLSSLYLEQKEYEKAEPILREAAKRGHAESQFLLAECIEESRILVDNWDDAPWIPWYRAAAEQGHAAAQRIMGERHYYGYGVEQDFRKAADWYEKAGNRGDLPAMRALAMMHLTEDLEDSNIEKGIQWYEKAAELGDVEAMYELGIWYLDQGEEGDESAYDEAFYWFCEADEHDHAESQYELGCMYEEGHVLGGVDLTAAFLMYHKAADSGHAAAQYAVAQAYYLSKGCEEDLTKSLIWLKRAADNGDPDAMYELSRRYRYEIGVTHLFKFVGWVERAAQSYHEKAKEEVPLLRKEAITDAYQMAAGLKTRVESGIWEEAYFLGSLYDQSWILGFDRAESLHWYEYGAEKEKEHPEHVYSEHLKRGHLMYITGMCYLLGEGTKRDPYRAVEWLRLAAERGHGEAMYMMGELYRLGHGVPLDEAEAMAWYRKGAEAGNNSSMYAIGKMYVTGCHVKQDFDQAFVWFKKASDAKHARATCWLGILCLGEETSEPAATGYLFLAMASAMHDEWAYEMTMEEIEK